MLKSIYSYPKDVFDVMFMLVPVILIGALLIGIYLMLDSWLGEDHIVITIYGYLITPFAWLFFKVIEVFVALFKNPFGIYTLPKSEVNSSKSEDGKTDREVK